MTQVLLCRNCGQVFLSLGDTFDPEAMPCPSGAGRCSPVWAKQGEHLDVARVDAALVGDDDLVSTSHFTLGKARSSRCKSLLHLEAVLRSLAREVGVHIQEGHTEAGLLALGHLELFLDQVSELAK